MEDSLDRQFGSAVIQSITPLTLSIVLICLFIILMGKRKMLMPIVLGAGIILPYNQNLVFFNLNFMVLRVIIIFAMIRVFFIHLRDPIRITRLDKIVFAWALSSVVIPIISYGTLDMFLYKIGLLINGIGLYIVFRYIIRNQVDVDRSIRIMVVISLVISVIMVGEQIIGRNILSILGAPDGVLIRNGIIRSTAGFAHPILAGMFGAVLLPFPLSLLWIKNGSRIFPLIGIMSSSIITLTSASSTPILAYCSGIFALALWPLRKRMREILWGFVFVLISLHLYMNAPVWALIGRIKVVGGSSGYHRYKLIDEFINRFGEWWLFGTKGTANWGWDMWDTVNAFVNQGVNGGLITLMLFILFIVTGFKLVGRKVAELERDVMLSRQYWVYGSVLFSHVVGFFGIIYFDQMIIPWYLLLAIISLNTIPQDEQNLVEGFVT